MEEVLPLPPLTLPPLSKISVAINPVALVTTECISVTSAMRKNARWAQSSVSAILGGGGGGLVGAGGGGGAGAGGTAGGAGSNSGLSTPVPGSPMRGLHRRKLGADDVGLDVGLAGRWGLRGKKGKSIQVGLFFIITAYEPGKAGIDWGGRECRTIHSWRRSQS